VEKRSISYKEAGVDIEAGNKTVQLIKGLVKSTIRPEVVTDIGGFGAAFALNKDNYKSPLLVSATDGVGTKLKIAFMMDKHDTVGIDCVAMCVNDVVCSGAEPLFFLDYIACGKMVPEKMAKIVKGVATGCREAGCALVGGETAEMPGFYREDEYDLAGFCVGIVEKDKIITGETIQEGDAVIGLSSTGLHSNGFSLVRKVFFEMAGANLDHHVEELGCTLGEELLRPTAVYAKTVLELMKHIKIKGIAHITGGGLIENIPRILPEGVKALINKNSWDKPPIFDVIQKTGNVPEREMYTTFNMGIGMVVVMAPENVDAALKLLQQRKQKGWVVGEITRGSGEVSLIS